MCSGHILSNVSEICVRVLSYVVTITLLFGDYRLHVETSSESNSSDIAKDVLKQVLGNTCDFDIDNS